MQSLSYPVSTTKRKDRKLAGILALAGILTLPGLHKIYTGKVGWGVVYLLFFWTPFPRIASAIEGIWYLTQTEAEFNERFNTGTIGPEANPTFRPEHVASVAQALRTLDDLRRDGLISEYEFEQKRRQLLAQIG
ncbi:NINE protein [Leptolyngbya sp. FACHB-261]|uniref:NINE protein n=1 Tax=Leptolyngbya sp. FACHB-261 TaxID=2692806 RepID=UPI0016847D24|nr:NINE protein [Leptolyngbya sp. FACHB-261]MBD2104777.1 NINE protein [Leptolyngbya sp. FACHB-261]